MKLSEKLENYLFQSEILGHYYYDNSDGKYFRIYKKSNPSVSKRIDVDASGNFLYEFQGKETQLFSVLQVITFLELDFGVFLHDPNPLAAPKTPSKKETIINIDSLELHNGSVLFDVAITYLIDRSDKGNVQIDILSVVWMCFDITKLLGEYEKPQLAFHLPNYSINL
jgi:hypothetical protein